MKTLYNEAMRRLFCLCIALPLAAQDYELGEMVRVAANTRHADGPAAPRGGEFLLFTDAPANKILQFIPNKGIAVYRTNTGGASGLALDEQGRIYMCEPSLRRVSRLSPKGAVEILASSFEGKPLNGPNDLALRHDGHLWFTDPAFGSQLETKEQTFFGVFHLTPRNEISPAWRGATRPGGVALSPNGRTLYVSDADARVVRMFDLDRSGQASSERILLSKVDGVPLGLRTDEKGNLFVAARGVFIHSPDGKLIRHIQMSDPVTNIAFGDPDFLSLYITSNGGVYRVRVPIRGAQP